MLMHEAEPEQLLLGAAARVVFHRSVTSWKNVITEKVAMMIHRAMPNKP